VRRRAERGGAGARERRGRTPLESLEEIDYENWGGVDHSDGPQFILRLRPSKFDSSLTPVVMCYSRNLCLPRDPLQLTARRRKTWSSRRSRQLQAHFLKPLWSLQSHLTTALTRNWTGLARLDQPSARGHLMKLNFVTSRCQGQTELARRRCNPGKLWGTFPIA
jgi:hypothetical protein